MSLHEGSQLQKRKTVNVTWQNVYIIQALALCIFHFLRLKTSFLHHSRGNYGTVTLEDNRDLGISGSHGG